jgi:pantoate--beta-alanine ligase
LTAGAAVAGAGRAAVLAAALSVLDAQPELGVDYLALVDEETWEDADDVTGRARLLVAARVGNTRLIDNVELVLGTERPRHPDVG